MSQSWTDEGRRGIGAEQTQREEFVYPVWVFALNIGVTTLFSVVGLIIFIRFWKPEIWPYAIIFVALGAPVWRNLYQIYRGPHRWIVDASSDSLSVERFDGGRQMWALSTLRRLPKGRLGRPYRVVDSNGNPAFEIWMYVSRYEELAGLIAIQR